jgi:hypothetical protein
MGSLENLHLKFITGLKLTLHHLLIRSEDLAALRRSAEGWRPSIAPGASDTLA